jgi:acid phosphatase family membrane protein YuiD
MDLSYLITPLFAWLMAGFIKFSINSISTKRLAFDLIGYGGMPSNHSSIVTSVVAIITIKEGLQSPAFSAALALAFIVILDANSLRQKISAHAKILNKLNKNNSDIQLRERVGHTKLEILAGVFTGILSAILVNQFFIVGLL